MPECHAAGVLVFAAVRRRCSRESGMQEWWEWVTGWNLLVVWVRLLPWLLAGAVVLTAGQWVLDRWKGRRRTRH
jgi:hypothetical protein